MSDAGVRLLGVVTDGSCVPDGHDRRGGRSAPKLPDGHALCL